MQTDYQSLINGIFICGLSGVDTALKNENIDMVIDVRAEEKRSIDRGAVTSVHIPLVDGKANQADLLYQAVQYAANAYREGKQVVLH